MRTVVPSDNIDTHEHSGVTQQANWKAIAKCQQREAGARMGVLLQAFYTLKGFRGLPCPLDGDHGADFWWDHLAKQAHALRQSGFTALWLPPALKCGSGVSSVGYDPFDDYDLGSKNQKFHVQTRYGSREQLARCVAMLRSNGLDVYVDIV